LVFVAFGAIAVTSRKIGLLTQPSSVMVSRVPSPTGSSW